jgi:hypothetical protein
VRLEEDRVVEFYITNLQILQIHAEDMPLLPVFASPLISTSCGGTQYLPQLPMSLDVARAV